MMVYRRPWLARACAVVRRRGDVLDHDLLSQVRDMFSQ